MEQHFVNFVAAKDCPYTLDGRNLAETRRAKLHKVAEALGVDDAKYSKNDLIIVISSALKAMDAPAEINELAKPKKKAKKKVKK